MGDPVAQPPAMTAYGVGEGGWDPMPWSWAAQRLTASRGYWLVTVSARGRPHSLPVWGVWDDAEHRFAFSCAPSARKAANLAANPRVVLTVESTVECVSIEGRAAPVTDPGREQVWFARYLAKYLPLSPDLTEEFLRANALFEVVPERGFGMVDAPEFARTATRWRFGPDEKADLSVEPGLGAAAEGLVGRHGAEDQESEDGQLVRRVDP